MVHWSLGLEGFVVWELDSTNGVSVLIIWN